MRLTQSDHTLQLPRRGGDPLFLGSRIDTGFTHLDVACDQGVGGVFGEDRVDLGSGVGDVCRENIDGLDVSIFALPHERGTYDNIMPGGVGSILEIQTDEMFGQTPIAHLINLVENQVQKIKSRDQGRGEIDIGRDR